MNYQTHMLAGLLIAQYYPQEPITYLLATIGALFADVDTPKSFMGSFFRPFNDIVTHRGFFHTFWAVLLLWAITGLLSLPTVILVAYMSHLCLDAITKKGIQPFLPFTWRLHGPFTNGKLAELAIGIVLLCIIAMNLTRFFATGN